MNKTLQYPTDPQTQYTVHPYKLMMWIAIVAIAMMFAGLTSAVIVKKGDPKGWIDFQLPSMFLVSTIIVILSSVSLWWAYRSAKQDEISQTKWATVATLVLGIAFCLAQFSAWGQLTDHKMFFSGDSASFSFIYVLSGLHLAHIVGGLIALAVLVVKITQYKVHKKNMLSMQLVATYWHFVGVLWVYLFLFLSLT